MTPKEKAEELYKKMLGNDGSTHPKVFGGVKRCALIAVDEILSETEERDGMRVINNPYWIEVKQEIEKL